VRLKSDFDGAETAGNSQAALLLVRLSALTDRADLRAQAEAALATYARRCAPHPVAMPLLLTAMLEVLAPPRHIVIVGEDAAVRERLLSAARAHARAGDVRIAIDGEDTRARLAALAPWLGGLPLSLAEGHAAGATAYVCERYTCRAPEPDPDRLAAALAAGPVTIEDS
jgi:hypothetical protein